MIKEDGSVYNSETNEYYGEYIQYLEMKFEENTSWLVCKAKTQESLDRIINIIKRKNQNVNIRLDDKLTFALNENECDIPKLMRFISFFDGSIGQLALAECIF